MQNKMIRQLTTSNFDFPDLVTDPKAKYVDKTDLLYTLCNDADRQLFISRPRRFGKSLMLSTLQAMFEGRRELFKGLALDSLPWECWDENRRYPVYSFTMAETNGTTFEKFYGALRKLTIALLEKVGLGYDDTVDPSSNFDAFLKAAADKSPTKKIVVLIDEYDEPVAKFLDDIESLNKVRSVLHDFYEKLKINSGSIRFLLMTGVTKLTKLSVFSGMNHLKDRTMDPRFATLLGYTPDELDGTLRENVEAFGAANGMDFAAAKKALLDWYDGYRFSPDSMAKVCNPVSLGCALESGKLKNYWESTGGATLVMNRLLKADKALFDFEGMIVTQTQIDVCDAQELPVESLLYQSGYLTLKETFDDTTYSLCMPNNEVRDSRTKDYAGPWLDGDPPVFCVGVNYDPARRGIDDPLVEKA